MNEHYQYDVFISYYPTDVLIVQQVASGLRKAGLKVWFDQWSIKTGDNVEYSLKFGLANSRVLLLFISQNSVGSAWSGFETQTFSFRDPLNLGRRFVPVLMDGQQAPHSLEHVVCVEWQDSQKNELLTRLVAVCSPPTEPPSSRGINVPRLSLNNRYPISGSASAAKLKFNSNRVAIGSSLGSVSWVMQGNNIHTVERHHGPVKSLDWHKSKPLLISGGLDRKVYLWNLENDRCISSFSDARGVANCVRFAEDAVVCASKDGMVYIWDDHDCRTLRGHTGSVDCVDATGKFVLSGGVDKTIRVWDLHTGRCTRVLEGHTDGVSCLAVSPKGDRLLSGSADQTVRLWDLVTGLCVSVFDAHTDAVKCLAWHTDENLFVSGGGDRALRIWSTIEGKLLRVLDGCESDVLDLTFLGDKVLAVDYNAVYEWQLEQVLARFNNISQVTEGVSQKPSQVLYTNAKVLLVGDSGAGKTGLSKRLAERVWEESPGSTVGAWATQWSLPAAEVEQGDREIWMWDFGGQADQRLIHQLYMDETALAVLVFDAQRPNVFESLEQWNQDLTRSTEKPPAKLLVAGRVDASYVRVKREDVNDFILQHGYKEFIETSARTNQGCDELREAIVRNIDWDGLPWRSSPALFKRLKEQIVRLKDEGRILMRFNELRDALRLRLPPAEINFTDAELKAVLSLLSGPGVVLELEFGAWVLLQPELINAYGQAVIATLRADPSELGSVSEQRVLSGDLIYGSFERIPKDEERFVLLEMHRKLLHRGLCARELTDKEVLLVFPSYYKRNRPELVGHPALLVSYDFYGVVEEIYATLVVQLSHTSSFKRERLWQDAVDFTTANDVTMGVKLSRKLNGAAMLDVYCDPKALLADKIIFVRYVHDHLLQRAVDVTRRRHYVCQVCSSLIGDSQAVSKRLLTGKDDIGCPTCDTRVKLMDDLEIKYTSPEYQKQVRKLEDEATEELSNESKERLLVGNVISAVAAAGHLSREKSVSDHGIDMEIEFINDRKEASGQLLFLQLKSGDSYLRQKNNGDEIFTIKNQRHVDYWADQIAPVMLVIRGSNGEIRWMEIRDFLKQERGKGIKTKQIKFVGDRLDSQSITKWRDVLLAKGQIT